MSCMLPAVREVLSFSFAMSCMLPQYLSAPPQLTVLPYLFPSISQVLYVHVSPPTHHSPRSPLSELDPFSTSLIEYHQNIFQAFDQNVEQTRWPQGLKRLAFGGSFNRSLELVHWPLNLEALSFGREFNQPVHRVSWPPCLKKLAFGHRFDHNVNGLEWPEGLKEVKLGRSSRAVNVNNRRRSQQHANAEGSQGGA